MCSGRRQQEKKRKERELREAAERRQRELDRRAEERRRELQALANQRKMLAWQQEVKKKEYQAQLRRNRDESYARTIQATNEFRREEKNLFTNRDNRIREENARRDSAIGKQKVREEQANRAAAASMKAAAKYRQEAEQTRQESEIKVRNMNAQSSAISSSLRVLSKGATAPGPTAQQSKKKQETGRAKTTSTGLRLGSQANTAGPNIAT